MECSEALDFLYQSFDAQLTPTQQMLLDAHRRTCFACANTLTRAERFQALLLKVPQLAVPRGLEERIIERVFAASHVTTNRGETWRTFVDAVTNWRSFAFAAGTAAAVLALVLVSRNIFQPSAMSHTQAPPSITAAINGSLDVGNGNTTSQQSGAVNVTPGETLANTTDQPSTIALSQHVAVTIAGNTQVKIGQVSVDPQTGDPNIVAMRVEHGMVGVRESLGKNAGAIHVATDQATVVPTGTIFTVAAASGSTDVAVGEGSVAVFLPGETFNVLAGNAAHISDGRHTVNKLRAGTKFVH
ncbi:MAG: FecR domain-containing protein [Candidatus Eremiobacteraeota bacterium]|nr:FecR domain-containing protein [Candidatus Eremiobacteraeota bacterium]